MKKFLFLMTLLSGMLIRAQLPMLYAEYHDYEGLGKYIDWVKWAAEDDGPGFFGDCTEMGESFNPSSTLNPQGEKNYSVTNLVDIDPTTAWVPQGDGIGASFEYLLTHVAGQAIHICNGYQASIKLWKENSRVKRMRLYKDGRPVYIVQLLDTMGNQTIDVPEGFFYRKDGAPPVLKFEILEVYPGSKYKDVALSDVFFSGCCFAGDTQIAGSETSAEIRNLNAGDFAAVIDLNTGKTTETRIEKKATQIHNHLIRVSTEAKSVLLTPGHPLYVKNYGFISMQELKRKLELQNYEQLAGKIEVLTWDPMTGEVHYETLKSVVPEKGKFETFTIQKLSEGENYIANGFVTKTY